MVNYSEVWRSYELPCPRKTSLPVIVFLQCLNLCAVLLSSRSPSLKSPSIGAVLEQLTSPLWLGVSSGLSISSSRRPYVIRDPFCNSIAFGYKGLQFVIVEFLYNALEMGSMYRIPSEILSEDKLIGTSSVQNEFSITRTTTLEHLRT